MNLTWVLSTNLHNLKCQTITSSTLHPPKDPEMINKSKTVPQKRKFRHKSIWLLSQISDKRSKVLQLMWTTSKETPPRNTWKPTVAQSLPSEVLLWLTSRAEVRTKRSIAIYSWTIPLKRIHSSKSSINHPSILCLWITVCIQACLHQTKEAKKQVPHQRPERTIPTRIRIKIRSQMATPSSSCNNSSNSS